MTYDVARVRGLIPSLGDGWIHLDPQAGMLVPDAVSRAVSTGFRTSSFSHIGRHGAAVRSAAILDAAREAVADLVGGDPAGVVLGPDRAVLLAWLAESLSSRLGLGTGIVLSRLDDEANVAPWLRIANRYGAHVRWAEVEIETCEMPSWQFEELIGPTARLVALTAASPIVGSAPAVRVAADRVHEVGGLLVADAFGAAPYALIDIEELNADVVALSAPAWGGPQIGALVFRDPAFLDRIPSMSLNPYAKGAERPRGGRAPVRAARRADHLDRLSRRARRPHTRHQARAPGNVDHLAAGLPRPAVRAPDGRAGQDPEPHRDRARFHPNSHRQFHSRGHAGRESRGQTGRQPDRHAERVHGGSRLLDALGVNDEGGAVTIGLAPYTTRFEIDQLGRALVTLE